jgi:2-polyprenyl-3-methyl-5-hydroxy-6-metoxy-1,4-benzoquinol methylase
MAPTPLSFWQKLQSLFYPVNLKKSSSPINPVLELFYHRGRYILATKDAVYSDGDKYRPLLRAFSSTSLKEVLPTLKNVLVLGTGLGSAVHILHAKGLYPQITLVELDDQVLEMALAHLPEATIPNVQGIHKDAFQFIKEDTGTYDLIIVDVFIGRIVPEQTIKAPFLAACKARLSPSGYLVFNYMTALDEENGKAKTALLAYYKTVEEISFGINKVYIATG